jgi:hypothetical protein
MRRIARTRRLLALVAGWLLVLGVAPATAQDLSIAGRVLGPDGAPVAGQRLLFHRVTNAGGELLAEGTSDGEGRFTLTAEAQAAGGVYFVATRYEGQLYIGPLLRPPFPAGSEYVVQVGVPGVGDVSSLTAAAPPAATGPVAAAPAGAPRSPGAVFAAVLLTLAIATGAHLAVRGAGPSRRRRALIRLARIADGAERVPERERRELMRRVTETSS